MQSETIAEHVLGEDRDVDVFQADVKVAVFVSRTLSGIDGFGLNGKLLGNVEVGQDTKMVAELGDKISRLIPYDGVGVQTTFDAWKDGLCLGGGGHQQERNDCNERVFHKLYN